MYKHNLKKLYTFIGDRTKILFRTKLLRKNLAINLRIQNATP